MEILKLFALAWFIHEFEPLQRLTNRLPDWIGQYVNCFKCMSFWLTLSITWNFYDACIVSFFAYICETIIILCSHRRK